MGLKVEGYHSIHTLFSVLDKNFVNKLFLKSLGGRLSKLQSMKTGESPVKGRKTLMGPSPYGLNLRVQRSGRGGGRKRLVHR